MRDFRTFYAGYVTSLLGSAMSLLAVAFAVLDDGGNATDLGLVMAAGAAPQVAIMLVGGVTADRFGRRWVMLSADVACCLAQGVFALSLFLEKPQLWVFLLIAVVRGTAQAFFKPAFQALTVDITPYDELGNAFAGLACAETTRRLFAHDQAPGQLIVSGIAAVAMTIGALILHEEDEDTDEPDLPVAVVLLDTISDAATAAGVAITGEIILATGGLFCLDPARGLPVRPRGRSCECSGQSGRTGSMIWETYPFRESFPEIKRKGFPDHGKTGPQHGCLSQVMTRCRSAYFDQGRDLRVRARSMRRGPRGERRSCGSPGRRRGGSAARQLRRPAAVQVTCCARPVTVRP